MDTVHGFIAYGIPAGFLLLTLWSIYALVRNKAPGGTFWNVLAVLQVIIGIQAIVGAILFLTGARPPTLGPQWLHYAYGGLFPAIVLIVAHRFARKYEGIPWLVFGIAGFIIFGLTFRALQTGNGWA
jgi:hypothetical protein